MPLVLTLDPGASSPAAKMLVESSASQGRVVQSGVIADPTSMDRRYLLLNISSINIARVVGDGNGKGRFE